MREFVSHLRSPVAQLPVCNKWLEIGQQNAGNPGTITKPVFIIRLLLATGNDLAHPEDILF
jgi:hypothetical protein